MISILCVQHDSNYYQIQGLDLWNKQRDAYLFDGSNAVICHPPCQQWSRLKAFAKEDKLERELALHCWEVVNRNGGILEHPSGSSLFKYVGASYKSIISVNQSWWGFPARKNTLLYFKDCKPIAHPLSFDAVRKKVSDISYRSRSKMPLSFCQWLVDCVKVNGLHSQLACQEVPL